MKLGDFTVSFLTFDDCWFRKCSSTFSCWVGNKNYLSNISVFISGFCMLCSYKLWVLCNQYIIYLTLSLASWLIGQILWTGTTKCNSTDFVILIIFVLKPLKLLITPSIIIVMPSVPAVLRFSLVELKEWSAAQLKSALCLLISTGYLPISSQIHYKISLTCFYIVSGTAPP